MEHLREDSVTPPSADARAAVEQARRLACALEGLLATLAEGTTTELERVDVRIAGAIARSLCDQLGVLQRPRAA